MAQSCWGVQTRSTASCTADYDIASIFQFAHNGTGTVRPIHVLSSATMIFRLGVLHVEVSDCRGMCCEEAALDALEMLALF